MSEKDIHKRALKEQSLEIDIESKSQEIGAVSEEFLRFMCPFRQGTLN